MNKKFSIFGRFIKYEIGILFALLVTILVSLAYGANFTPVQKKIIFLYGPVLGIILIVVFMVISWLFLKKYEDFLNNEENQNISEEKKHEMIRDFLKFPIKVSFFGSILIFGAFIFGIILLLAFTGLNFTAAIRLILISASICVLYILISIHLKNFFIKEYVSYLMQHIKTEFEVPKLSIFKKIFITVTVISLLILFNVGVISFTQAENVVYEQVSNQLLGRIIYFSENDFNGDTTDLPPLVHGDMGYWFTVDKDGQILNGELPEDREFTNLNEEEHISDWIVEEILKTDSGVTEDFNAMKIYCYHTLKGTDVKYVSALYYLDPVITHVISGYVIALLVFTFVAIIIIIVTAYFFSRQLADSVNDIKYSIEKVTYEGNLNNPVMNISNDEVGELSLSFNTMLGQLQSLSQQADIISQDDLQNEELDTRYKGDLGDAFWKMIQKLRKLATQAEAIASDDLKNPILKEKMQGDLGSAFTEMVEVLLQLGYRVETIAEGDLSVTVQDLEDGDLRTAFKRMVINLREMVEKVKEAGLKIASSSAEILSSSEELASGAGEQAASVEETSSTIEEFATTARQIAENAEIVAKLAEETLKVTEDGTGVMEDALSSIEGIKVSSQNTSKRILELGDKSKRIGNIVELIDEISTQTKLLALNASIEAAGAGEAGKRFGVVAVEIKKLAENVAESTEEIRNLINEIQLSINSSIMSTEDEIKKVEEGVFYAGKVNELLKKINDMVGKTTDAAKQISFATQQQKTAGDQVVFTMKDISNVTKQSAASTKQVMNSTEELNSLAEEFKSIVDKFKIDQSG